MDPGETLAAATNRALGRRPPTEEFGDLPISLWSLWTVQAMQTAVRSHALGNFAQAAILVEGMLADDRVQAATNGRIKAVTRCEPRFEPSELPGGEEAAEDIEARWDDLVPDETLENLLQWSVFMGFALAEIIWEADRVLERWMPRLKVWHPLTIFYNVGTRRYTAITTEGPIEVEEDDPKWFLYTPFGAYRGWLRGAVRSVAMPWIVRQYALRDFARYSEKHGMPMVVAKMPYQAPAEDKARFAASLRTLGSETSMTLPVQGGVDKAEWDVMLLEARDRSWESFRGLRDVCDQSITLAIRGTNLTTEVDGGSYAAAKAHREEDADYAQADRKKLAKALRNQLLRPYCLYNHGDEELAPKLALVPPETQLEPEELAKVWGDAANAVTALESKGWKVDRAQVAGRFGIPLRQGMDFDDDEDRPALTLTPSDTASIVTVNEARAAQGMEPLMLPGGGEDPDGELTIAQFVAKRQASVEQGAEERPEEELEREAEAAEKKTPTALKPFAKPGELPEGGEEDEELEEEEDIDEEVETEARAFRRAIASALTRAVQGDPMTIEEAFKRKRVAIAGGPKTGKSTLAQKMAGARHVLSTDSFIDTTAFEDVPDEVAKALAGFDEFVVEGVQVARCLRRGLQVDVVVVLEEEFEELSKERAAMAKGCRTVFDEWLDTMASVPVLMPTKADVEGAT